MAKKIYVVRKDRNLGKENENDKKNINNENKIFKKENFLEVSENIKKYRFRAFYEKSYKLRFISHLELIDIIKDSLIRSGVKIIFSKGFHPLPIISFGPPLSVGHIGENEIFDFEVFDENFNESEILENINKNLPSGMFLKKIIKLEKDFVPLSKLLNIFDYTVINDESWSLDALDEFLKSETFFREIEKKGKKEILDLKLFVKKIEIKNFELNLIVDNSKKFINLLSTFEENNLVLKKK